MMADEICSVFNFLFIFILLLSIRLTHHKSHFLIHVHFRFINLFVRKLQVNFCTYFSKGVADNVGIWDFDEFFIPKGENKNLLDVIEKAASPNKLDIFDRKNVTNSGSSSGSGSADWTGGRGWADGSAHPYCFLKLG